MIRVLIADEIARIVGDLEKLEPYHDVVDVCGVAHQASAVIEEAWLRQPDVLVLHERFVARSPLMPLALWRKRRGWMMTMAIVAVVGLCAANGCGSSVGSGSGGGGSTTPVTSMLTISAAGTGLTTATQQLTLTVQ